MTAGAVPAVSPSTWINLDLRRMAAAGTAGLVAGFFINGIGSRLAMMLLAVLNPEATGVLSDDGFVIGQFNLGDTIGLVVFATLLGVLGGFLYLVIRPLRFGPRWFQTLSVTLGPAIVVGNLLVEPDGVDFTRLEPGALAIALFVVLPGLYAFTVSRLVDRWLEPDAWSMRPGRRWTFGLVPIVAIGPASIPVAIGVAIRAITQLFAPARDFVSSDAPKVVLRVAFAAIFVVSLVALTAKSIEIV